MQNMGGIGGLMGMMPGIAKMKNQLAAANLDEKVVKRQMAVIDSMTREERTNPDILKASRKKRIAAGAGLKVEEVNKLLKMHRNMADMMKAMGQGKRGPLAGMAQMMGFGGGGMPSAEAMKQLADEDARRNSARRTFAAERFSGPSGPRKTDIAGPRRISRSRQEEITRNF